uniref:FAP221 n=1 Tax=Chlamydomonas reinhardtii TaxID=3055 RepID=D4P3R6_CHLRE|nr:FAP221 [Chlamydomonas reinhardtii]7SQC_M0 Chain M0, FAP221 [Chlamydomonas reinhardtii]7SQC_M1 Chain M1, FAP221 [Chlamydomonas reinhardtii]
MFASSGLPPAMEGLVEDAPLQNPNTLTYNRVYSKVGNTRILQAEPAVLNFGGYELGKVYSQVLRIRNVRASGTRFHIIPPSTPFFKATCPAKKGLLAPGMTEEVAVEFCPTQYRYYYDCVRVHCEEENLLIPLHAYPVANEALFPTRVDFGRVALGQEVVRSHTLECKVPVDFEYEIVEVKPNPAFRVEPARGVVPGRGRVTVDMWFCPLALTTEEAVIEVRIAEFNSKPVQCRLTGSAFPGAGRDAALAATTAANTAAAAAVAATLGRGERTAAAATANGKHGGGGGATASGLKGADLATMEALEGGLTMQLAAKGLPVNPGGGTLRGGAGNGDAYTVAVMSHRAEAAAARDCRRDGPIRSKPPLLPATAGETEVAGVYVPDTMLLSAAEVGYVLNQSPGRLRTKDVRGAIEARKAAAAEQQAALEKVLGGSAGGGGGGRAGGGGLGGIHPLERPDIPADVKGALFRLQLALAEEAARKVALGTAPHSGQQLLTAEQVRRMQRQRQEQHRRHQLSEEKRAARRLAPELEAGGAVHQPSAPVGSSSSGGGGGSDPAFKPEWRLIEGSDWHKRTRVLDKFMRAVWRVVTHQRLQRRLERIKEVLAHLGYDKQRLAEEAANPVLLVSESDRPGTAPTKYLRPEMVRVRPLPLYRDVLFQVHHATDLSHYTDFDELAPFTSKVPLEYRLLGYAPEPLPGLTPYLPPLADQPLLEGAVEEVAAAGERLVPSGLVPPLSDYPTMPDACKNMPYITLEIGNRYGDDRVYGAPDPSYSPYGSLDVDYAVQPRQYDVYDSARHEAVASGGVRSLRGGPGLSDSWLVRQDTWAVQLGAEVVPALMSGPGAGELPEDRPEDGDKPKICPAVPTDEQLAKYLPTSSRAQELPPPPGTAASAATTHTQLDATTTPRGDPSASPSSPSTSSAAPTAYRLVRDRHVSDLEAAKAAAAAAALQAWERRLEDYNALLRRPCQFALHL